MKRIFVNLKRFDVPRSMGGVCPDNRPDNWIRTVISRARAASHRMDEVDITFFVPEALIIPAVEAALMIGRGELKKPGIHAAESALEPADFLPRLEKRGIDLKYYE